MVLREISQAKFIIIPQPECDLSLLRCYPSSWLRWPTWPLAAPASSTTQAPTTRPVWCRWSIVGPANKIGWRSDGETVPSPPGVGETVAVGPLSPRQADRRGQHQGDAVLHLPHLWQRQVYPAVLGVAQVETNPVRQSALQAHGGSETWFWKQEQVGKLGIINSKWITFLMTELFPDQHYKIFGHSPWLLVAPGSQGGIVGKVHSNFGETLQYLFIVLRMTEQWTTAQPLGIAAQEYNITDYKINIQAGW